MRKRKESLPEWFQKQYQPEPNSGCWIWLGRWNLRYATIHSREPGREWNEYAHRYSWQLHRGPIPDGLEIDHKCRNTLCVNPDHLEPTTRSQNQQRHYDRKRADAQAQKIVADGKG